MGMYRKKKATDAEAVSFSWAFPVQLLASIRWLGGAWRREAPLKERRMEIVTMLRERPMDPYIIGLRRLKRPEKNVG